MIPQEDWVPADGLTLEPNAYKVVRSSKNIVVSAGPGAGKTELLAQRADFLLRTGVCRYPRRILAISFKVDAARNLDERVRKRSGGIYSARFDSMTFDAFSKMIVDNYRAILSEEYRLDDDYEIDASLDNKNLRPDRTNYNQLKERTIKIIESNPYVLWSLRQAYSHIFIDEFQDTTDMQYRLFKKIFGESNSVVTAVGDEKQKIMVWAGALEGIVEDFERDFDANKISLYRNFRSLPRLQRVQQNIARVIEPNGDSAVNNTIDGTSGDIHVLSYASDVEEAEDISGKIQEWIQAGTSPDEIAVLVRQQSEIITNPLVKELQRMDILYCDEAKIQGLLEESIAIVAFNFLKIVIGQSSSEAYIVLNQFAEHFSASDAMAQKITNGLSELIVSVEKYVNSELFEGSDDDWLFLFNQLWALFPDSLFHSVSGRYQQEGYIRKCKEKMYKAFFDELRVDGNPSKALSRLSGEGAVKILTIHKSKGLEFEKVILLGVENQLFWSKSFDYAQGTKIPKEVLQTFFVAVSRAKHELILTSVRRRSRPQRYAGRWDENRTSYTGLLGFVQGV